MISLLDDDGTSENIIENSNNLYCVNKTESKYSSSQTTIEKTQRFQRIHETFHSTKSSSLSEQSSRTAQQPDIELYRPSINYALYVQNNQDTSQNFYIALIDSNTKMMVHLTTTLKLSTSFKCPPETYMKTAYGSTTSEAGNERKSSLLLATCSKGNDGPPDVPESIFSSSWAEVEPMFFSSIYLLSDIVSPPHILHDKISEYNQIKTRRMLIINSEKDASSASLSVPSPTTVESVWSTVLSEQEGPNDTLKVGQSKD